jgi:hypothetical protein
MAYGRKAGYIRAYEFGCLPPILGEQEAIEAMTKRTKLWNRLVQLDRTYDVQREMLLMPYITAEGMMNHDEYVKDRREAFKRDEVKQSFAALEKEEYLRARKLCRESGLYWCNYEDVLLSWQKARRGKGELRFHSPSFEGKVTVRWQNGLPTSKIADSRLHLDAVPSEAYTAPRRERRRLCRSKVSIRVRSEGRNPVWLSLPCVLHRPLPDGLLRSASVIRERIGMRWRWKLILSIKLPTKEQPIKREGPEISLDIGWRKLPAGLRVCYWHDDSGQTGELVLPNHFLNGMQKVEDIRSIRDKHFNSAVKLLADWLSHNHNSVPDWLEQATENLSRWHSTARLASLVLRWRDNRFTGDEKIFEQIEEWRKRDKHLLEYEANLRDKLIKRRREIYRVFAADIAKRYARVKLEKFNISKVARDKELVQPAQRQRVLAAPSVLRLAIASSVGREGGEIQLVEAKYTTMICNYCGSVERFDKAAELSHKCSVCGTFWDQDANAARNISQIPALAGAENDLRKV